jgi:flagellar FliL protein
MKNMKIVIAFVAVAVIGAAVAGGAVWWLSKGAAPASATEAKKKKEEIKDDGKPPRYLTVDKVIIMLRRQPGDTSTHYMSADLVVTTNEEHEKVAKDHLPMLRSVAVKTLSSLPVTTAQAMTIDQFAAELNKAFDATYEHDHREKPFSEVMIGKLIIE